jgi:hypothetical protein
MSHTKRTPIVRTTRLQPSPRALELFEQLERAPIGLTDQQPDAVIQAAAPLAGTPAAPSSKRWRGRCRRNRTDNIRTNYGTGFQRKTRPAWADRAISNPAVSARFPSIKPRAAAPPDQRRSRSVCR